ncbi:MAG: nitroreductase family deazaflavin-dependent oxidoreductase [Actinobacteria bacterium]|nr:nitroreductase family deazaflavin-dependent oxidoreductase [Actinomycetota bacterium]
MTIDDPAAWLATVSDEPFAYLTTTGRVTGRPHEIEIWFAVDGATAYFLAGGRDRADWVRNLLREPRVTLRIADRTATGHARIVDADSDEDARARHLVWSAYTTPDRDLVGWRDTALPIAVDVGRGTRDGR